MILKKKMRQIDIQEHLARQMEENRERRMISEMGISPAEYSLNWERIKSLPVGESEYVIDKVGVKI
jgi:hypothetical protein